MSEEEWESIELNKLKNIFTWNWSFVTRIESLYLLQLWQEYKKQDYLCSDLQEHFLFWERIVNQKNPHMGLLYNNFHPT